MAALPRVLKKSRLDWSYRCLDKKLAVPRPFRDFDDLAPGRILCGLGAVGPLLQKLVYLA